jgi:hypothetical protein
VGSMKRALSTPWVSVSQREVVTAGMNRWYCLGRRRGNGFDGSHSICSMVMSISALRLARSGKSLSISTCQDCAKELDWFFELYTAAEVLEDPYKTDLQAIAQHYIAVASLFITFPYATNAISRQPKSTT